MNTYITKLIRGSCFSLPVSIVSSLRCQKDISHLEQLCNDWGTGC